MGSHSSFCLDISKAAQVNESEVIAYGNSLPDFQGGDFAGWMWRRFSPESKWHGADNVAAALSKKFPDVIFRLRCRGDYDYTYYFLNGVALESEAIFNDPFPSKALFAKKLKEKTQADYFAEIERQKKKKADQEAADLAELQRLKAKQAEIEARLGGSASG